MSTQPVIRKVLIDQLLPAPLPTTHVEIRRITMEPNTAAGAHAHNGPVFGSIERGAVIFRIADEPAAILRAGDIFYEPAGVVVSQFDATEDGAVFLGYFLLTEDQTSELRQIDAD
ncbi:cupin domain-containing protein [Microbacterium sp. SS28]|uniref:cupin domain-containing protein n=1 Tax=Microbacterium sp. SS28 TaxID=2919948 RepID=UPI001FA95507|nr:cupin domain-containing protein [Microbacterium sp. SS28]